MATRKIEITSRHNINFGTADKPDHKTLGDVVECDAKQAEGLINGGYAKYVEQPRAAKKEENADGGQ